MSTESTLQLTPDQAGARGALGRSGTAALIVRHVVVYAAAALFMVPLIYAFFSALKPNGEMFAMPPRLIGSEVRWSNFADVFQYGPFWTYIGNSLFIGLAGTLVVLFVSTTAG